MLLQDVYKRQIGDIAALAQACGIGEDELAVGVVHRGINGVAGGAGLVGHDQAVLAQDVVDEAGFAHIGAADDSNGDVYKRQVYNIVTYKFRFSTAALEFRKKCTVDFEL